MTGRDGFSGRESGTNRIDGCVINAVPLYMHVI